MAALESIRWTGFAGVFPHQTEIFRRKAANPLHIIPAMRRRTPIGGAVRIVSGFVFASSVLAGDDTPLAVPSGWTVEVVARAPDLKHPSVVCCASDGRVFVAEDPMDISAASADLPQGRILCFHPDGRRTVFAEKLHAVFGMQYLEGKLYVLHNPRFAAFADGGDAAAGTVDLIESTNPKPWALDWNDHVPANFRLAMDGYFYIAVGDKGLFGAVGRDGRRADLHGGGIARIKPDGTGLEILSTGVRNILDVAMNAEDELFTYDNTDEHEWMSRLTHMVDGGYYGYPFDFIPQRPYTLWKFADYGSGAATGALAYTEGALPTEYDGNLFLADFERHEVLRVAIERAEGTYRVVKTEPLARSGAADFWPVGIALSADGASLYVCDWEHNDEKVRVECGSLLKIGFRGGSGPAPGSVPRPSWYVPAASGKKFEAGTDELVRALSHPARSVRLTAQRRLSERGGEAIRPLAELLTDRRAASTARWHALWALDAVDGGALNRASILALLDDPDASVRRQALRQLGERRAKEAGAAIADLLRDADPSIRFQAATALGRIGDPAAIPALLGALQEPQLFPRFAIFTALGRIGRADPAAWPSIVAALDRTEPAVREAVGFALREIYDERVAGTLASFAGDGGKSAAGRAAAMGLLAEIARRPPAWKGEWWAYHPFRLKPPAKTEPWEGTLQVSAALRRGLDDGDAAVRAAAAGGLAVARQTSAAPRLRELLARETDRGLQSALIKALGALGDRESLPRIAEILDAADSPDGVVFEAIAAAEAIGGDEAAAAVQAFASRGPRTAELHLKAIEALGALQARGAMGLLVERTGHADEPIRRAAAAALARIDAEEAARRLVPFLSSGSLEARKRALSALSHFASRTAVPELLRLAKDPETKDDAAAALARIPDPAALGVYLEGLRSRSIELREACRRALRAIERESLPEIEERIDRLAPDVLQELRIAFGGSERARTGPLFSVAAKTVEPEEYLEFAAKSRGDAARGRTLFDDLSGLACLRCHRAGREGGDLGPDLSGAGAQFDRRTLAESVLFPSKAVREGYTATIFRMRSGEIIAGVVKAESADEVTVVDSSARPVQVRKSRIRERTPSPTSIMPEGLQSGLKLQDFADVIEYLTTLKKQNE